MRRVLADAADKPLEIIATEELSLLPSARIEALGSVFRIDGSSLTNAFGRVLELTRPTSIGNADWHRHVFSRLI
jgi:hypothetical protein